MFFKCKNLFYFLTVFVSTFFVSTISNAETGYMKFNYGISTHDTGATTSAGTITYDDEDEGFIFSAGYMVGDLWGVDVMYFDLGSSSIGALDVHDKFKIGNDTHHVTTAGTINNDISGYGIGIIGSSNNNSSWDTYLKAGVHSWDKSGSTTLLGNNNHINAEFFSQGIGAYAGIGVSYNVYDAISVDVAYDIIGLSKDASFDSSSTLISLGFRAKF